MGRYSAKELEAKFRGAASIRVSQKISGDERYSNDANYWTGGACNWGGSHNLKDDCRRLAELFSEITELRNARKKLVDFTNQEEFEKNKLELIAETEKAINSLNMRTSNNTSIGGICIIWNDFADFFKPIVNDFREELEVLKSNIERVPYNEVKELKKLLSEERKLQKEIEENERKARNEPDENKRKKFIFLVEEAKDKWKKVLERKKQFKISSLGDDFNPDNKILLVFIRIIIL